MSFFSNRKEAERSGETELRAIDAFIFNYAAAPAIAEKLGLSKETSIRLIPHSKPILDPRVFQGAEEFEAIGIVPNENQELTEGVIEGLRIIEAFNYWLVVKDDFIYIEPRSGANFSGIKNLAKVQAKIASTKNGEASNSKHWVLVNFAGLPGPSPREVIAGIISAAIDALKAAKSEIVIEGFCETEEYLLSSDTIDKQKRETVANFIRLGSLMDNLFVSPAECGTTEPGKVIEYLVGKIADRGRLVEKPKK